MQPKEDKERQKNIGFKTLFNSCKKQRWNTNHLVKGNYLSAEIKTLDYLMWSWPDD